MRLKTDDIDSLIHYAQKLAWATGSDRRRLEAAGIRLSRSDFYSETPTLVEIEQSFEYPNGVDGPAAAVFDDPEVFDLDRIAAYASELVPFSADFDPPRQANSGFFWDNSQFAYSDAMSLYATIRMKRPNQVLEIGSGFSSMVAAEALAANGSGQLTCIDPQPRADISAIGAEVLRQPVQQVDPRDLAAMVGPGDIVFYDGSHTVKTGSDTVYFYLKVLPLLPRGVLVHCHDIQLPFPQPSRLLIEQKISWSEQYLLMALLLDRRRYRVLFSSSLLAARAPAVLYELMRGRWGIGGASIWFDLNE